MEIFSISGPLPPIPDSLTIPQFIFDCEHVTRPVRRAGTPWLIDDTTGKAIVRDEVCFLAALGSGPCVLKAPVSFGSVPWVLPMHCI